MSEVRKAASTRSDDKIQQENNVLSVSPPKTNDDDVKEKVQTDSDDKKNIGDQRKLKNVNHSKGLVRQITINQQTIMVTEYKAKDNAIKVGTMTTESATVVTSAEIGVADETGEAAKTAEIGQAGGIGEAAKIGQTAEVGEAAAGIGESGFNTTGGNSLITNKAEVQTKDVVKPEISSESSAAAVAKVPDSKTADRHHRRHRRHHHRHQHRRHRHQERHRRRRHRHDDSS